MSIHWWDTIAIIPLMVPNYSSYKDWDRTTNGAILPFWVNLSDHLQKSASHNPNSERKKILTSSPETWTYGNTDLAVFVPLVDHFPCENSILLDFYTPRVPTISVPISEVRIQLGLRAVYIYSEFLSFLGFNGRIWQKLFNFSWPGSCRSTQVVPTLSCVTFNKNRSYIIECLEHCHPHNRP